MVKDDEEIIWEKDKGGKITYILLVGFIGYYFKLLIKALFRKIIVIISWPQQFHYHFITILFL